MLGRCPTALGCQDIAACSNESGAASWHDTTDGLAARLPGMSRLQFNRPEGCLSQKQTAGVCGAAQVHYMQTGGRSKLLSQEPQQPTMKDLRCASPTPSPPSPPHPLGRPCRSRPAACHHRWCLLWNLCRCGLYPLLQQSR